MFNVGFPELALIAIVALVVLGPERLPEAARALGKWVGRARRMMRQMSEELEREVDVSDLRAQFRDAKRSVEEEWEEPRWYGGKTDTSPSGDAEWDDEPDEAEVYGGDVNPEEEAEQAADRAEGEPAAASAHEQGTAQEASQDEEPPQADGVERDGQAAGAASGAGEHDDETAATAAESPDLQEPGEEPAEAPETVRKPQRSARKRNGEQEEPAVESVEPERQSPHSRVH